MPLRLDVLDSETRRSKYHRRTALFFPQEEVAIDEQADSSDCCWSLFVGFQLACCSDEVRLWPPLWSTRRQQAHISKWKHVFFASTSTHIKKKHFFQDVPHASNWLATILGAFFIKSNNAFFLSVHPCEAHFESQSLQASVDTFDSESGSSGPVEHFSQTVERGCAVKRQTGKRQATALSRMSELCNNTAEHSFALHA